MPGPEKRPDVEAPSMLISRTSKGREESVVGEGSMELDLLRERRSKDQPGLKRKASKQSMKGLESQKSQDSSTTADASPIVPATSAEEPAKDRAVPEPEEPVNDAPTRAFTVTMYSSALTSELGGKADGPNPSPPRTKARSFAVTLPDSCRAPSPPPPPRGHASDSVHTVDFRQPQNSPQARDARFRVWSDSPMVDVKTPELAAGEKADAQAWIRVAFKPSAQPRRTREYVYIAAADARKGSRPQRLCFDLEYI